MSAPPPVPKWFQDGFHAFLRPYLRRHFHTIAIHAESTAAFEASPMAPLIVYANHPSWWDPLIAHFLCWQCFAGRQFYAPMDAQALEKYKVFEKLGFYGVQLSTGRGAARFLKTSLDILRHPGTSLWITPEGRFTDCRDATAELMPGLAHLCLRMPDRGIVVPLALEYAFWEERLPECLVRIGHPISCDDHRDWDKERWRNRLADALRATQRSLAADVIARDPSAFRAILRGSRGAGGFYDGFRRLRSWLGGRPFRAEHGRKFN